MWFIILLNTNICSESFQNLPSPEFWKIKLSGRLPPLQNYLKIITTWFIITLACTFNILKDSRYLERLRIRFKEEAEASLLCLERWVGVLCQRDDENVSHTQSWNRHCSSWSSRKVALFFYILWHPHRWSSRWTLTELAVPGEAGWDFPTFIQQEQF